MTQPTHHQEQTIPLFPLGSLLFPGGRAKLQIFEPRYVELVSHCMKEGTGFGMVGINKGKETQNKPSIFSVGTYVHIVDFESLPNGLLGITVEGVERFEIDEHWVGRNNLNMAEVSWIENVGATVIGEDDEELVSMLKEIYPDVEKELGYTAPQFDNGSWVAARMIELLPLPIDLKVTTLADWDSVEIFNVLKQILEGMQIKKAF